MDRLNLRKKFKEKVKLEKQQEIQMPYNINNSFLILRFGS
jgi:hypothetical protein